MLPIFFYTIWKKTHKNVIDFFSSPNNLCQSQVNLCLTKKLELVLWTFFSFRNYSKKLKYRFFTLGIMTKDYSNNKTWTWLIWCLIFSFFFFSNSYVVIVIVVFLCTDCMNKLSGQYFICNSFFDLIFLLVYGHRNIYFFFKTSATITWLKYECCISTTS